jgi:hypothetical protein
MCGSGAMCQPDAACGAGMKQGGQVQWSSFAAACIRSCRYHRTVVCCTQRWPLLPTVSMSKSPCTCGPELLLLLTGHHARCDHPRRDCSCRAATSNQLGTRQWVRFKTSWHAFSQHPASCFQVTAPMRPDELAVGVAEYIPFQLPEELKKRGAVYSHADTIDAPWAVRSGGTSCALTAIVPVRWCVIAPRCANVSWRG